MKIDKYTRSLRSLDTLMFKLGFIDVGNMAVFYVPLRIYWQKRLPIKMQLDTEMMRYDRKF